MIEYKIKIDNHYSNL